MTEAVTKGKKLRISVLRDRYQTSFMTPRQSRHEIRRRVFVPFNKLRRELDGFTCLSPFDGADLVHAHNRIPISASRMICSFESHIPRQFGLSGDGILAKVMTREIVSKRCRRLIGMSHFARRIALDMHDGRPEFDAVRAKLMVQHPNVELGRAGDRLAEDDASSLTLTFLGGHFIRKGGCVAARIAERALELGLPVHVNIVSSLQMGAAVWSDPTDSDFADAYKQLLELPNVTHYPYLPNAEARQLMGRSHFSLLPTFEDTFGFSAIESMAEYTPVIGTGICALPEFIVSGRNGFLLDLEKNSLGQWLRPNSDLRDTQAYADFYRDAIEALADQAIQKLQAVVGRPDLIRRLRTNARLTAEEMFSAEMAGKRWDDLYERVIAENCRDEAVCHPVHDRSSPESADYLFEGQAPIIT